MQNINKIEHSLFRNIVFCCVDSTNDRTDIFWCVADMSVTCLKVPNLREKPIIICMHFFAHVMHSSYYKELKNALKNNNDSFFWIILWYAPHKQIHWWYVSDMVMLFSKFSNRTQIWWHASDMSPTFPTKKHWIRKHKF